MTAQSAAKGMGETERGRIADPPTPHERTMQSVAPPALI